MDVGCYSVSGSRLLGGEPEQVYGEAWFGPSGTDWVFAGTLRFPGDVIAIFDCGTALPERDELEAIGSEGSLFLDDPWHCNVPVIELRRDGERRADRARARRLLPARAGEPERRDPRRGRAAARPRRRGRPGARARGAARVGDERRARLAVTERGGAERAAASSRTRASCSRRRSAQQIEVADFGLGRLEEVGLQILVYVNTERVCAKELVLFPRQACPEHRHPPVGDDPGQGGDLPLPRAASCTSSSPARARSRFGPGDQYTIPPGHAPLVPAPGPTGRS